MSFINKNFPAQADVNGRNVWVIYVIELNFESTASIN